MAGYSARAYRRTHRPHTTKHADVLRSFGIGALIGIVGIGAFAIFSGSSGSAQRPSNAYPVGVYSVPLDSASENSAGGQDAKFMAAPEQALEERIIPAGSVEIADGVYFRQGRDENYPVNFFELIIDKRSDAKLFVTEPIGRQTLSTLISTYGADACVNGGPFNMEDGSLTVYTMYKGDAYSSPEIKPDTPTVCFSGANEVGFGTNAPHGAKYCLTGFQRLITDGQSNERYYPGNEGYKDAYGNTHPRTMIVDDAVNDLVYLVVVDGRSESSGGLSTGEMVDFVKAHYGPVANAVNLDGGGSSEMIYNSASGLIIPNAPSDGSERAISHAICVK